MANKRAAGGSIRAKVMELGNDTSGNGFKRGGSIAVKAAKVEPKGRARGGRTGAPFSSGHDISSRSDGRSSGHEGE